MADNRNEINRLRREIARTGEEMSRMREEYESKYRAEMDRIRSELSTASTDRQRDLISRFKRLEQSMCDAFLYESDKAREKYDSLAKQVEDYEKKLAAELQRVIDEQKADAAKRSRESAEIRRLAEESIKALDVSIEDACRYPVDLFYPHALQRYVDAGHEAEDLLRAELYSLALSKADCTGMFVERLADDTAAKVRELEMMLELYRVKLDSIREHLASPEAKSRLTEDGETELELDETDLDYWSDLLYTDLKVLLDHHESIVLGGVDGWLASCRSGDVSPSLLLDREMQKLDRIPRQLGICITYALSACDCYNYLNNIKYVTDAILKEQNYKLTSVAYGGVKDGNGESVGYEYYFDKYLKHEACVRSGERPDYREERVLTYEKPYADGRTDRCIVYVVPVRTAVTVSFNVYVRFDTDFVPMLVASEITERLEHTGLRVTPIFDGAGVEVQRDRALSLRVLTETVLNERESCIASKYSMNI